MIDDIEREWSRRLGTDVEIEYVGPDYGYVLRVEGWAVDRFRSLTEVESFLNGQPGSEREVDAL